MSGEGSSSEARSYQGRSLSVISPFQNGHRTDNERTSNGQGWAGRTERMPTDEPDKLSKLLAKLEIDDKIIQDKERP